MDLVTPDNVSSKPGWKVTSTGKLLRPMRMRPGKPLPPPIQLTATSKEDKKKIAAKERKKKKDRNPATRARKRTIDVTRWGGERLSGIFLGGGVADDMRTEPPTTSSSKNSANQDEEEESSSSYQQSDAESPHSPPAPIDSVKPRYSPSAHTSGFPIAVSASPVASHIDLALEQSQSLNLIKSIFGGKDETNWIGRESVGSDVGEALEIVREGNNDEDVDYEVVPMDVDEEPVVDAVIDDEEAENGNEDEVEHIVEDPKKPPPAPSKLKDLFAPREDEGMTYSPSYIIFLTQCFLVHRRFLASYSSGP